MRQTTFTFGGYAKLDLVLSRFGNGLPAISSPIRDMYLPGAIPAGEVLKEYDTQIHAKESRFNFEVKSELLDRPVRGFIELDFLLSMAGDQRVSNSYNPRLRHFFFQWGNLTFGQTWTTFMTPEAIPDGIIFLPGSEGLVFIRQAQVRYKLQNWEFALENPETTLTPLGEGSMYEVTSGGVPDVIIKYTSRGDFGTIGVAGIYRLLLYEDEGVKRHSASGYGISVSGALNTGDRDHVQFMMTYGSGMGRYLGFAFTTAAVVDQSNELQPINSINGIISLTHYWSDKWRSTMHAAFFIADDNSDLTSGTANRYCWSGSISLLYAPHPKLLFGVQALHANRQLENGTNGELGRIQFSAKYTFNYSHSIYRVE